MNTRLTSSEKRKARKAASLPAHAAVSRWKQLALVCVVVLAVIVVFHRLLSAEFTTWDDAMTIWKNWALNPPTLAGLKHHWLAPHMDLWIPITYTAWWLAAHLATPAGGPAAGLLNPAVFHGLNLLLHAAYAVMALLIFLRLTGQAWASLFAALLLALHPVQVETVAWASGAKDLLCGVFSLLAIHQYVVSAQRAQTVPNAVMILSPAYLIATIALCLAMLSKPAAVVVPAMAAVIDLLLIRRHWRAVVVSILPWLALIVPIIVVTKLVQPAPQTPPVTIWLRPLVATDALAFYLCKLVIPLSSGVDYGHTSQLLLQKGWLYFTWLIPLAAAAGVFYIWRKRMSGAALLVAGAAIFLIALAPVLGLIPFDFQAYSTVADHYLYLPLFGVALALASLPWTRRLLLVPGCAVLVLLAVSSWHQTRYWNDTFALFTQALRVNPSSAVAHNSLASWYVTLQQSGPAIEHASRAIQLNPTNARAHVTLGSALILRHDLAAAQRQFQEAINLKPDDSMALGNLAGLLAEQGKFDQAFDMARRAIENDPFNVSARTNLGAIHAQRGQWRQAEQEFRTAVRLDPRDVRAHANLGTVLLQLGQLDQAEAMYRQALRLDPDFPSARRGLDDLQAVRRVRQSP